MHYDSHIDSTELNLKLRTVVQKPQKCKTGKKCHFFPAIML